MRAHLARPSPFFLHTLGRPTSLQKYSALLLRSSGTAMGDLPEGLRLLRSCADYARVSLEERTGLGALRCGETLPFDVRVELDKIVESVLAAWAHRGELFVCTSLFAHSHCRSSRMSPPFLQSPCLTKSRILSISSDRRVQDREIKLSVQW